MKNRFAIEPVNLIFMAAVLACAFVLARPLFFISEDERKEYVARQNARAVCTALDIYAGGHEGAYPAPDRITGNAAEDILIKEKILLRYPANPFSEVDAPMSKSPFGRISPGDFSYTCSKTKKYEYKFVVYGKKGVISGCETRL